MPYICPYCVRPFSRSDVRRIHYQKCSARIAAGAPVPSAVRQGRKAKACDSCARRKRSCDEKLPCSACEGRGIPCTFNRYRSGAAGSSKPATLREDAPRGSVSAPDALDLSSSPLGVQGEASGAGPNVYNGDYADLAFGEKLLPDSAILDVNNGWLFSGLPAEESSPESTSRECWSPARQNTNLLPFMRNFASSKDMSTILAFTYGSSAGSGSGLLSESPDLHFPARCYDFAASGLYETLAPDAIMAPTGQSKAFSPNDLGLHSSMVSTRTIPASLSCMETLDTTDWIADPMFPRTRELLMQFRHMRQLEAGSATGTKLSAEDRQCLCFFSPPNIQRLLVCFWENWYPHCPIIHYPTFDPSSAPLPLLLIMILLGAAVSRDTADGNLAAPYFRMGEKVVFQELISHQKTHLERPSLDTIQRPTSLQAALLACCLQNWGGDSEARTRVRRSNYYMLVDVGV